ncbi:MAG: hypothetical protein PXY39_02025 [archaeon]|jgi:hypothetical protein|nr:hypothetical protein [archaeon]
MPVTAVVISFDDDYSCLVAVQENLSIDQLEKMVGREVQFDVSKNKIAKGKVTGLEGDLLSIKWQETPLGLGQSSMLRVMDQ